MKCKNIECSNGIIGKRIYCSLSCRNIYVNKYLRNYDKCSDTFKQKRNKKEEDYLLNPKKCKNCEEIIIFDKKEQEFCGHSCAASSTNGDRDYSKWSDKISESLHNFYLKKGITTRDKMGKYSLLCNFCNKDFLCERKNMFCSKECVKNHKRKDVDEFISYKQDTNFKFNLRDFKDEFDFGLIEKHGWYLPINRGNNLKGVSRDHMLSVRDGFDLGIDPKLLSHPANCRLMIHNDNISKNRKSILTIDELLERIKYFEEKYKNKTKNKMKNTKMGGNTLDA